MLRFLRLTKRVTSLGIILIAIAAVAATSALAVIPQAADIVTASDGTAADLDLSPLAQRSEIYAADGSFLTNLADADSNREEVTLDEVPQPVIDAILTIEDADFYQHDGINLRATFRALVENVNAGGIAGGGSTITQQVVKNSLLSTDQNFDRKSTEAFYALRLEEQMTKDEILERYLNTVYFGAGALGIKAAAETYWGYESVEELGWNEAVLLAGVIRNPFGYDPTRNPDQARDRRGVIVDRLVATGHLTEEEGEAIKVSPLPAERQAPVDNKPTDYFADEVQEQLLNDESILGGDYSARFKAVYGGGLKVYTTFDPGAQAAAIAARDEHLPDIKEDCFLNQRLDENPENPCLPNFTIAIVTVDSHTGGVKAMVGGSDFQTEKFNLATQAQRQPGSSMKTFVLAEAFQQGHTPNDTIRMDGPCQIPNPGGDPDPYEVKGSSQGPASLAAATRASNNCAFVRLGAVVGDDKVIDLAGRLGIDTSDMTPELSLPLGVFEVSPMEMAAAYAAFPNDGVYNEPYLIERVEDRNGDVIYEHRVEGSRAVEVQTARMVAEVLESNVASRSGTGWRAAIEGHHAAGKTGTTQEFSDAWFVGFTDYYTTAVWLGDPDERIPLRFPQLVGVYPQAGGYGGEVPAATWGAYMTALHANLEPRELAVPDPYGGGTELKVDGETARVRPRPQPDPTAGTGDDGGGGGGTNPGTPTQPTQPPATQPPATQPPASEPPATQPPATEPPQPTQPSVPPPGEEQ